MHTRLFIQKVLNILCQADITRVLLLNAQCSEKTQTGMVNASLTATGTASEPRNAISCLWLDSAMLGELVSDAHFRISHQFIADFELFDFLGVGAVAEGQVAGILFLVPHRISPRHNRCGCAFRGIGLDLPKNVQYLFKVVVKPEFRGRRINASMISFALQQLESQGLVSIVTTTEWTNTSFLKSVESMGFKRCGRASEFVLAGRHFFHLPAPFDPVTGATVSDDAFVESIRFWAD